MEQTVPRVEPFTGVEPLFRALGISSAVLPVEHYDNGATHILVALASEDDVAALRPDVGALAPFAVTGVDCFAGSGTSWKSRMFWPLGEDAATGSAAGPIACHLARHGVTDWGEDLVIRQGAEIGRPSILHARAEGGAGLIDRVVVGGQAVTVARGEFRLPS
jgi:trans-2,3-dihydro-3-hydroxyanthranilate isomerase